MNRRSRLLLTLPLVLAATLPAAAQRFPALGGVDVRGSAVENPVEPGEPTAGAALDLDLGSFIAPVFRPFIGGTWFTAAAPEGASAGDLEVMGGRAGVRVDAFGNAAIAPYVFGAVTGLQVDARVEDEDAGDLLSGFNTGATAGGGIVYSMGGSRRIGLTAEGSYTWINNLNHWSAGVGLRFRPFGRGTYGRADRGRERVRVETLPAPVVEVVHQGEAPGGPDTVAAQVAALRAELARLSAARTEADPSDEALRMRLDAAESEARRASEAAADAREAAERAAAAQAAAEARADSLARLAEASGARLAAAEAATGAALLELGRIASATTSFRETERGIIITLGEGLFATGRSELDRDARAEVARVAYVLGHFRGRVIRVEGHTDDAGAETANQSLSERRAAAVRAALIAEGIAPERVIAVGYGESRPAAANDTPADRARNRRVEVVITDERP